MPKVEKSEQEWQAELTPEQYRVLREKGTEAPFSGEYDHVFEPGSYRCAGCGAELFDSDAKYDSGCGWPAFYAPSGDDAIDEETDRSHGMLRGETRYFASSLRFLRTCALTTRLAGLALIMIGSPV